MPAEARSFASVLRRAWNENALFAVLVELTYRCNLDCFFCYNDLALAGTPMTTPEWVKLFEDLSEMQVLNLTLSGGEPLAHPDFFLLGRKTHDLGFVVRVKSNGHALGGTLARRLDGIFYKSWNGPYVEPIKSGVIYTKRKHDGE